MQVLQELLTQFIAILPRFIAATVVTIIGMVIAKSVAKILGKILALSGIDKIAEMLNEMDFVQSMNIKIQLSGIIAKVIYYMLLLIFIIAATDILGMPAISKLVSDIINYFPLIISASIVLMLGVLLADFIKGIVQTTCKSLGIPSGNIIANIVFYFIFINAVIVALSQANIDTGFIKNNLTVLLGAIAGAFALGYGLASKDLMSSILASFYHKDRFDLGDVITIEGVTGEIIEIDNASITLQTDGKRVVFPSSKLHSEKVEIHDQKMLR
jgi:small-conductance mechanosensitive channel